MVMRINGASVYSAQNKKDAQEAQEREELRQLLVLKNPTEAQMKRLEELEKKYHDVSGGSTIAEMANTKSSGNSFT